VRKNQEDWLKSTIIKNRQKCDCCVCFLTEFGKYGPSPNSYTINYHFAKGVTNKSFTLREFMYLFLSDQQKIFDKCILRYFDGSQLVNKSYSKQSLGEFRSWQETLTRLLLHDGGMPDAVVADQVQVQVAAVVTPQCSQVRIPVSYWVKALKRQQWIKNTSKKKAYNNTQEKPSY